MYRYILIEKIQLLFREKKIIISPIGGVRLKLIFSWNTKLKFFLTRSYIVQNIWGRKKSVLPDPTFQDPTY
jgi:hypothetical protein